MSIFRRKNTKQWQRFVGKVGGTLSDSSAIKAGVGALASLGTLTAVSAVVSAARRKSES